LQLFDVASLTEEGLMPLKCPFAAPLTKGIASCRHAREVVRRGGSEYDCASEEAHRVCADLFSRLKDRGLGAFGMEEDLTSLPHSVLVKIPSGGLLGLARITGGVPPTGKIEDIAALIDEACIRFGGVQGVPVERLEGDMTGFQLERRARRR
jgi:hypothetical protein